MEPRRHGDTEARSTTAGSLRFATVSFFQFIAPRDPKQSAETEHASVPPCLRGESTLKRKRHPRKNELPDVVLGQRLVVREERAVAQGDRDVAGDFPVDVGVRFGAEEPDAGISRLVDRGVLLELAEAEEIGA